MCVTLPKVVKAAEEQSLLLGAIVVKNVASDDDKMTNLL
jgi:hypothetical protein